MINTLSHFLYRRSRAVLAAAMLAAIVSGAFGLGVAGRLDPFGATDPATQSVQATNRFQAAAHRRIEPDVIALVRSRRRCDTSCPRDGHPRRITPC